MPRLRELPPTAGLPLGWRDLVRPGLPGLERAAARLLDVEALQLTCSGTAALLIALVTLRGLSRRRKVIVPAYTCPLVAHAVAAAGLELVVCDVVPGTPALCPRRLAALLDAGTLAVVPTHLAGRVVDVAGVQAAASRAGAWVIEDAAQAFGARRGGQPVGTLGDVGFYSLAVGKGLTLYEGGLLHARDPALRRALADTAQRLARPDAPREALRVLQLLGYALLYRPATLGLAYGAPLRRALRAGDLVGAVGDRHDRRIALHPVGRWRNAVGTRAIGRLPQHLQACARQAAWLRDRLDGLGGARVLVDAPGDAGTWPCLLLVLPSQSLRDAVLARVWARGIGASRLFIHALPDYPALHGLAGAGADVPNARDLAARTLTFGTSPWVDARDAATLARALRDCGPAESARSEGPPDEEHAGGDLVARATVAAHQR